MGLFSKKQTEPAPEPKRMIYFANIPAKACRTEISDDENGTYFKGCHLWAEDNKLRAFQGDTVLFEVTNRSKAYGELEHLIGKQLTHITMTKKESDYGVYYRAAVAIDE